MRLTKSFFIVIFIFFMQCNANPNSSDLTITWHPVNHFVGGNAYFLSKLTVTNQSDTKLGHNWQLYFNSLRGIIPDGQGLQGLVEQGITITKADDANSGDYYVMKPLPHFAPVKPGESRGFDIYMANWAILKSDAPSGFHISFDNKPPEAVLAEVKIDPDNPRQTMRESRDNLPVPTPELRYQENGELVELKVKDKIIPSPFFCQVLNGEVTIDLKRVKIDHTNKLADEAKFLYEVLKDIGGQFPDQNKPEIWIKIKQTLDVDGDDQPDPEGYRLQTIPGKGVMIIGADEAGVFYGIQTLRQLITVSDYQNAAHENFSATITLPHLKIMDKPRFQYRGMMLDVARHFQTKEDVMRLLDLLAFFKINKFHFHLNDDEGWRLEIPGIPELTEYGSRRGFDLSDKTMQHMMYGNGNDLKSGDNLIKPTSETEANLGNQPEYKGFENALVNFVGKGWGYYTAEDFEDILQYAAERHIDVIPEIEMPAHARAAIQSMEYRYRKYKDKNLNKATQYRLIDPVDTSNHETVQNYRDNFVNPALPSTYHFLETVVKSLKNRYTAVPGAKLTAIHGGGDELPSLSDNVWWQGSQAVNNNPKTKNLNDKELVAYFSKKWQQIITDTGAKMLGWSDLFHNADSAMRLDGFIPLDWNNVWTWGNEDYGYKLANKGYQVILAHATNLYLDMAYNKDPNEPGFYWADFVDTRKTFYYRPFDLFVNGTVDQLGRSIDPQIWNDRTPLKKPKNIIGMQAQLWGENQKVPEFLDYFTFPKILGFCERAWQVSMPSKKRIDSEWRVFTNSLGQHILPILDYYKPVDIRNELPGDYGVAYRVPLPGATVDGGILRTNCRFPGLTVEYTKTNGKFWWQWRKPSKVAPPLQLRTKTHGGRYSRIVEIKE